jgi:hypothetical protein
VSDRSNRGCDSEPSFDSGIRRDNMKPRWRQVRCTPAPIGFGLGSDSGAIFFCQVHMTAIMGGMIARSHSMRSGGSGGPVSIILVCSGAWTLSPR